MSLPVVRGMYDALAQVLRLTQWAVLGTSTSSCTLCGYSGINANLTDSVCVTVELAFAFLVSSQAGRLSHHCEEFCGNAIVYCLGFDPKDSPLHLDGCAERSYIKKTGFANSLVRVLLT